MNKKYYLALAVTAALFAGCSSDDNFADEARQAAAINDGDKAKIELLLGNAGTRGTGTVGGMATNGNISDPNNKWGGQKFNVYMLDKGTLDVAVDATGAKIYDNKVFTAPNELAGVADGTPAMEVTTSPDGGLTVNTNVSYFPQEGNFDFWAYRTDGAEGTNVPMVPNQSSTSMLLDFTIDGTQDIMTAKAVPNVPANADGTYGTQNVPEGRIFSAYSVRREVKPVLNFEHQLARIAFKVKGSKALCNYSADPNTSLSDTLNSNDLAVRVTGIELKSLATGKLHVAYTATPAEIIEWTAGSEAVLPLKQRGQNYTPAVLAWKSCSGVGYGTITVGTNAGFVFDGTTLVYTSQDVDDKKGLPLAANAKTAAQATTDGDLASCYLCNVETEPIPGAISVNADLVALEPVAPVWNTTATTQLPDGQAFATPVGEALLVAPQLNYELTVKTIQKVAKTKQTSYCTVGQQLYQKLSTLIAGSLPVITPVAPATTAAATYDAAAAGKKFEVSAIADAQPILDTLTIEGTYYFKIGASAYREAVVDANNKAVKASYMYFVNSADAAAALAAYLAWYADQDDADKTTAKDNALAKGSDTKGGAVTVVTSYTWKPDTKTIQLNGPSTTTGSTTTYKPYKANKSYTITLTLAGMESITGDDSNIGIGGYDVDTEGSEFDIDMDSEPSVNP